MNHRGRVVKRLSGDYIAEVRSTWFFGCLEEWLPLTQRLIDAPPHYSVVSFKTQEEARKALMAHLERPGDRVVEYV